MTDVVVSDTNIFLDLDSIGLLRLFCENYKVHTTRNVLDELVTPSARASAEEMERQGLLKVRRLEWADVKRAHALRGKNTSDADCTVLLCAIDLKCRLLTGDRKLRQVAEEAYHVEVSGIIRVIDELKDAGSLSTSEYVEALRRLKEANTRLPVKEIEERILRMG